MSPVEAIHGTGGAYVPCDELAAELPPLPEGAIVGQAAGFVAKDELAAGLPADPFGAIVGSGVGFVAKPCEEIFDCGNLEPIFPAQVVGAQSWSGVREYDPADPGEVFENFTTTLSGTYPVGHSSYYVNQSGILWSEGMGVGFLTTFSPFPLGADHARITGWVHNEFLGVGHTQGWRIMVGTWGTGVPDGVGVIYASGITAPGTLTPFDFVAPVTDDHVQFWLECDEFDAPDGQAVTLGMRGENDSASLYQFNIAWCYPSTPDLLFGGVSNRLSTSLDDILTTQFPPFGASANNILAAAWSPT